MFVTDTNENNVLNWNTKIEIVTKYHLKTLKRLKDVSICLLRPVIAFTLKQDWLDSIN